MLLLEGGELFLKLAYQLDEEALHRRYVVFLPEQTHQIRFAPDRMFFRVLRSLLPASSREILSIAALVTSLPATPAAA